MFTPDNDIATNLNIRISSNLKNLSSVLLQSMGVNQSQYIRDALQYVVDHNVLPWQANQESNILYRYTARQNQLYGVINHISQNHSVETHEVQSLCTFLDDLHLHSIRLQDMHHAQGVVSIHLSKLSGLFIQLTSLFRYNGSKMANIIVYSPIVVNQIRHLVEQIDISIKTNNL